MGDFEEVIPKLKGESPQNNTTIDSDGYFISLQKLRTLLMLLEITCSFFHSNKYYSLDHLDIMHVMLIPSDPQICKDLSF